MTLIDNAVLDMPPYDPDAGLGDMTADRLREIAFMLEGFGIALKVIAAECGKGVDSPATAHVAALRRWADEIERTAA
jgi:hypothetical protein